MEFEVQGNYGAQHGWETVGGAEDYADAKRYLRDYQDNQPQYGHRVWAVFGESEADKRVLEFFANMLSDGSGYINYWASVKWIGDSVQVTDDESKVTMIVEPAALAVAHAELAEWEAASKFHCCGQDTYVQDIQAAIMEGRDELDYDACTADACFQLAVLGDII